MRKCSLDKQADEDESSDVLPFMFGHYLHVWYYFLNFKVNEGNAKFPKVSGKKQYLINHISTLSLSPSTH